MDLAIFAQATPVYPEISIIKRPEFDDDPSTLRWRAWWNFTYDVQACAGVELICYPVLKLTPAGAWIDPIAYHHGEWVTHETCKRWVSNDGGQAWAKSTQQDALDSLLIRHKRWASRLHSDVAKFRCTLAAIEKLFPDRMAAAVDLLDMVGSAAKR
jgi:hypothetical protein